MKLSSLQKAALRIARIVGAVSKRDAHPLTLQSLVRYGLIENVMCGTAHTGHYKLTDDGDKKVDLLSEEQSKYLRLNVKSEYLDDVMAGNSVRSE